MATKAKASLQDQLLHAHVPRELIELIQRESKSANIPFIDALDHLTKWYKAPGFVTSDTRISGRAWAIVTYAQAAHWREKYDLLDAAVEQQSNAAAIRQAVRRSWLLLWTKEGLFSEFGLTDDQTKHVLAMEKKRRDKGNRPVSTHYRWLEPVHRAPELTRALGYSRKQFSKLLGALSIPRRNPATAKKSAALFNRDDALSLLEHRLKSTSKERKERASTIWRFYARFLGKAPGHARLVKILKAAGAKCTPVAERLAKIPEYAEADLLHLEISDTILRVGEMVSEWKKRKMPVGNSAVP